MNGSKPPSSSVEVELSQLRCRVVELEDSVKDLESRNLILGENNRLLEEMRRRVEGELTLKDEEIGRLHGAEVTFEVSGCAVGSWRAAM